MKRYVLALSVPSIVEIAYSHQDELLVQQVRNMRFLVLDEADRMIEAGHFAEMDNILRLTVRQSK